MCKKQGKGCATLLQTDGILDSSQEKTAGFNSGIG